MTELTLFDATAADVLTPTVGPYHRDDPITSREAALRNAPRSGTQRAAVLLALADAADGGLTGFELWGRTPCRYPHVATTRVEELVRLGLAEPTDDTRPTDTGAQATVWRITAVGAWVADEMRRAAS